MKSIIQMLLFVFVLSSLACGGGSSPSQMSGVLVEADFSTAVCQPKTKVINIRNDDTNQPQRLQNLAFEAGTNQDGFFSISKAVVGSTEYSSNSLSNIVIPAGGVISIYTVYNPRNLADAQHPHSAYISLFLNGPRLGIPQVKLTGTADGDLEACGEQLKFNVNSIKIYTKLAGESSDPSPIEVPTANIQGQFIINVSQTVATIAKTDFPRFTFNAQGIPVSVALDQTTTGVTADGTSFNFENVVAKAAGALDLTGKLSTGEVVVSSGSNSLTKTGTPLSGGRMKLVFGAPAPESPTLQDLAPALVGSVIVAEIELTQI